MNKGKNTYQICFYLYQILCNDTFYWQYIWSFSAEIKTNISHNVNSGKLQIVIDKKERKEKG